MPQDREESPEGMMTIAPLPSVPEMLGKLARPDFTAEDIAHRVHGAALGRACALHVNRIWDAVEDVAGLELADADTAEPAGVRGDAIGFRVGDVDEAVAQVDAARAAELFPLGDEAAVLLEDLDAVVGAVGNEEPPLGVHGDIVRGLELGGALAQSSVRANEFVRLGELWRCTRRIRIV